MHQNKHKIQNNKKYWQEKIKKNKERDLEVTIELRDKGWVVLRFWESQIINNFEKCVNEILRQIITQNKL